MKSFLIILLLAVETTGNAQKMRHFNTRFSDTTNKDFFKKNTSIDHISYSYNFPNSKTIGIFFKKEKTNELNAYGDEFYNLNFIGDKFIFEKKYGPFLLPENKLAAVLHKKCGPIFYLTFNAKPDSGTINLRSYCLPKKDDEQVFIKVEVWAAYKFGIEQLEKFVQLALDKDYFSNPTSITDSIAIFHVMVPAKDSCLQNIKLLYGERSPFTEILAHALKNACAWVPALQEGRKVHAYIKIYARLNSNRSITIAYPENK